MFNFWESLRRKIFRLSERRSQSPLPHFSLLLLERKEGCAVCKSKVFTGGIGTTDWNTTDNWENLTNRTD
jgi:hypothetical protein